MPAIATRLLLILASLTTAFTISTYAHAGQASAAVTSSHTRLWWDGATCRAFGAGRMGVMVTDSRHADTYLRVDVALWVHDHHRHASAHVLGLDRSYLALDCAGSYGL